MTPVEADFNLPPSFCGEVLFADGYGMADLESGVPMTLQTGLRAGSVSKPVTARCG